MEHLKGWVRTDRPFISIAESGKAAQKGWLGEEPKEVEDDGQKHSGIPGLRHSAAE